MAMNNMLTLYLYLDTQPGGVLPELHLKENCSSVHLYLIIRDVSNMTDIATKDCLIRGIRPDGSELYIRLAMGLVDGVYSVHLYNGDVKKLAAVAGTYKCTLSIADTRAHPTRNNYMDYDFQTVLPFQVIVYENAGGDADA